jgi:hypothetical protein
MIGRSFTAMSKVNMKEKVMKRFDRRTVIVTGGARGMGAKCAASSLRARTL